MGFPILVRRHLYIESEPWTSWESRDGTFYAKRFWPMLFQIRRTFWKWLTRVNAISWNLWSVNCVSVLQEKKFAWNQCQDLVRKANAYLVKLLGSYSLETQVVVTLSTRRWLLLYISMGPGVGVTKAPFVNFSVSKIFDMAKVHVRFFESHSYLTGVTAAELRQHLSNMNMIFNR